MESGTAPFTRTCALVRYLHTIELHADSDACRRLLKNMPFEESLDDLWSQRNAAEEQREIRFPLDAAVWVTCRRGFSRTFGKNLRYVLDTEIH